MTSQMTIGKKLFLCFGAALALTLIVSAIALQGFSSLGADVNKLVKVNARKLFLAADLNGIQSDMIAAERGIIARTFMKDKATVEQYHRDFGESVAKANKEIEEFVPLIETVEARQLMEEFKANVEKAANFHAELYREAGAGNAEAAAAVLKDKAMPLLLRMGTTCNRLEEQQGELMATVATRTDSAVSRSRWITIVLIALSLAVGVIVVLVVRTINNSLRQTVTELREGSEQVASAATQVSASSQSLAQGSSEQAASLEETSASTEEINSMARRNADNSRGATDLVNQSQQKFVQTNQALDQMVIAMSEINTHSDKISKIIKVIDGIAFQTNILALNAAVEAARAGEAGMGFAVVADEVRNLAQRSAQAARDTASLIEESITKSNDGKVRVDQVAEAIRTITAETLRMKTLVEEVNLGSQEQSRGIEQIGKAITQMEQVTQKIASNSEESASAAEELNAQSLTMKTIVDRLNSMVGGGVR